MFVHSFLYLIQKGYTEEASAFLKKWSPEHLEYHEDEIRSLTLIQTAEQLQVSFFHNARIRVRHRSPGDLSVWDDRAIRTHNGRWPESSWCGCASCRSGCWSRS